MIALKKYLEYEPNTGIFRWKINAPLGARHEHLRGQVAGWRSDRKSNGYVQINICKRRFAGHHLAFYFMTGKMPKGAVDHINRIKNDNRWSNLRECNQSENMANISKKKTNTTGFKGVSFYKRTRKFVANIRVNYTQIHLGYFNKASDAARAYDEAAVNFFGEFAQPNEAENQP